MLVQVHFDGNSWESKLESIQSVNQSAFSDLLIFIIKNIIVSFFGTNNELPTFELRQPLVNTLNLFKCRSLYDRCSFRFYCIKFILQSLAMKVNDL